MKSLGVIETRGWGAAIQAVDAACKAAGVTCIGYRKVGSGLVSVCFEGEISAIHTAIERGSAVAETGKIVQSLVIARPERCVVEALSNLKGNPTHAKKSAEPVAIAATSKPVVPQATPINAEDQNPTLKKGKKS